MERVLVVFQATDAETESLALAFGLGAVEGGANIRLRRLDGAVQGEPEEHLEHQGYVAPKDADLEWAQAIGLALESAAPGPELMGFLEQMERVGGGKTACVFGGAAEMASVVYARGVLGRIGAVLTESGAADAETARDVGREVASQG